MAATLLVILGLYFLSFSAAQTVIGSSPSFSLDQPGSPAPYPTKDTVRYQASFPPRGRSDVPIRATLRDGLANSVHPAPNPTVLSSPSLKPTLSTLNHSNGPIVNYTSVTRPRTDTASLAISRAKAKLASTTKATTLVRPTLHTERRLEDVNLQGQGSGNVPAFKEEPTSPEPTLANQMAQYRPPAQTATSERIAPTTVDESQHLTEKPDVSVITTSWEPIQEETKTIESTVVTETETHGPVVLAGEITEDTPSPDRSPTILDKTPPTTATTETTGLLNKIRSALNTPTKTVSTEASSPTSTSQEAIKTATKTSSPSNKTAQQGPALHTTTTQLSRTGVTSYLTTGMVPVTRPRLSPTYQTAISPRNRSSSLGRPPHKAPHSTINPVPSPSVVMANGTLLYWGDLSRTLAFVWELHVYGTASLFLLLFAGAALGLTLSPGTNCPHHGALALANIFLFVAGGIRATFFLTDPYGTRKYLPRPAVTALYNLPLHLLVWTQAAMALLSMRVAGVSLFPSTLERPPLVAVLAVLQCTLLLATDLLSPALSPVVPVTLQVLSLCWGLAICLGFLCYVFPRIRCTHLPHAALPEEPRRKAWTGSRRLGVILGRVLAVCAVLGALCCGLHVHATLWLYGLLGDWTRFNWGWWLVHFWARLLELAWGFSLLLLASWLFWKPQGCRGREEAGTDGRAAGDVSSPGQSTSSAHRHTCWSKIVQSLRGKPCRKSDSNGVGSAQGEVPNNWAGQDRSAADISKSLIRNQNHGHTSAGPGGAKDNNRRSQSAERGVSDDSTGSLLRLQTIGRPPQRSVSGSQDLDKDISVSLYDFDLRPPSPIDLTRSIDEALHREHLVTGGSLFHPQLSHSPSPGSGLSQGPWLRRNSDPQLSESSEAPTESSMPLGGSILSSVPSRQVTAPPTPSHQGHKWAGTVGSVPSSVSCPASLRPSRTSTGRLEEEGVDDTRPFITPDSDRGCRRAGRPVGSRSYLEVSRHDDSASVSSEIIDL